MKIIQTVSRRNRLTPGEVFSHDDISLYLRHPRPMFEKLSAVIIQNVLLCIVLQNMQRQETKPTVYHVLVQWPLLLTWFNFNPSMDK